MAELYGGMAAEPKGLVECSQTPWPVITGAASGALVRTERRPVAQIGHAHESEHMKRIGILTSGGDAPGMNAAIRATVRTATLNGTSVVGYLDGYSGYVSGEYVELDDRAVGNIIQRGGTMIGTARCPEFHEPAVRRAAAASMRDDGVEAMVIIGGDGSFRGALELQDECGVPVAGIPGTIDNDVFGTDETIGFDTAVNTALLAIDQLRDTSESTGMMFFVEVMGRTSGALALQTAVAGGAAGVLVPEAVEQISELVEQLRGSFERGKRSHIIVVAEGDEAGGAFAVGEKVRAALNHPFRCVVLGHIQRGGRPTMRDRLIASEAGAMAVEALFAGRSGMMIGRQGGVSVEVPLTEVVSRQHPTPNLGLIALAQKLSG
ncbi:MAG: ATP-dependent 6-phosphofructokinase [Tepidiformaceae bacterium]